MIMLMIVGLLISLNSYASEWSPATCYKKHVDDPRAIIIGDDPYNLSQSAPVKSAKNPLYIKEPEPTHLRKVKSQPNTYFSWDADYELKEDSPAFVKKKKKITLATKLIRTFSKSGLGSKEEPNATRN